MQYKILIVDDSSIIRTSLKRIFSGEFDMTIPNV